MNDEIISNVYQIIPKDFINKIENLDKKKLLDELSEEKEWNFKYIKYKISAEQKLKIKLIDDFEVINDDLFKLFKIEQNISFKNLFYGNIIFGKNKMFVFINHLRSPIFEIGHFDENDNFNVEYLFNQEEILESNIFIEYLLNLGIDQLLTIVKENQKINFNNKKINCYKVDKSQIEEKNSFSIDDKLKVLILLLIYEYRNNLEEVYLINKLYLDVFNLDIIYKLINENDNDKIIIKDNHNDFTFEFIDKIINNLDNKSINEINKTLNNITENNMEYKAKKENLIFFKSKTKIIYKDFVLVSKKIYNYLQNYFKIKLNDLHISYISINNRDILIDNAQFIIFIGKYEKIKYSYNIFPTPAILYFSSLFRY